MSPKISYVPMIREIGLGFWEEFVVQRVSFFVSKGQWYDLSGSDKIIP